MIDRDSLDAGAAENIEKMEAAGISVEASGEFMCAVQEKVEELYAERFGMQGHVGLYMTMCLGFMVEGELFALAMPIALGSGDTGKACVKHSAEVYFEMARVAYADRPDRSEVN
jgi:hypothetical protein